MTNEPKTAAHDQPAEPPAPTAGNRRGYALMLVLMVMLIAGAVALHASLLGVNTSLAQVSSDRSALLDDAALSGIEEARDRLNARIDTVPLIGYGMIENGVTVPNLPGGRRWTYVGRRGNTNGLANTGEFGVIAHIISQVKDITGATAIRRAEIYQQSFARYADFTDLGRRADGVALYWAMGDQAAGPVHSNDTIRVWTGYPRPQATFHAEVTTARIVEGKEAALFMKGPPLELAPRIELPSTADLDKLKLIAAGAGYSFAPALTVGDSANATIRIQFIALDADGDGNTTGPNDGYFRVYRLNNVTRGQGFARASVPVPPAGAPVPGGSTVPLDSMLFSPNCGRTWTVGGVEVTSDDSVLAAIPVLGTAADTYQVRMARKRAMFDQPTTRCFLGGDERLNAGVFRANDGAGQWMARTSGTIPASLAGRADAAYLWPLSPELNPSFRGVIFIEGTVALSGTARGRVTVAARNNIVIAHDLVQAQSPGTVAGCSPDGDILGLFSGQYTLAADNLLTTPQWRRNDTVTGDNWLWPRKDFDPDTRRPDLAVHAVILALRSSAAENPTPPATLPAAWYVNRGVMRLVGGQIQGRSGQTGTMNGSYLHGFGGDLSYNSCALQYPPPFFPTTGRWSISQYFEVNPLGFTPALWFSTN